METLKLGDRTFQVCRYDGTQESIAEFARSSYAFGGSDANGQAVVFTANRRREVLRAGDYILRLAALDDGASDNRFVILTLAEFYVIFGG